MWPQSNKMEKILHQIEEWNSMLGHNTPEEVITFFASRFPGKIALASSMGAEDQVLTDMVSKMDIPVKVFTLDTGRLFPETYELIQRTRKKYNIPFTIVFPDKEKIEQMVNEKGINLFYESIENRKLCCYVRKKEPLKRALKGMDVWICGLRKEQSLERFSAKLVEWDESNGLIKINPLITWNKKAVWEYIKTHNVPFNTLHDKGYPSIGCQPCTRATENGEEFRTGRWWWEQSEKKECGLHRK